MDLAALRLLTSIIVAAAERVPAAASLVDQGRAQCSGATPQAAMPALPTPVNVRHISGRTTAASFGAAHDAAVRRLVLTTPAGALCNSGWCAYS
jgi:hypothetical protein